MESKIEKYFSKHPVQNSVIYTLLGIGLGAMLANPWFNPHPVRYGLLFIAIAAIGHIFAYKMGKKKK